MARFDLEQLDRLIERHAAALAFYARQWTTAADDVVQDAFEALLRQDEPPENPPAWLYGVVRRLALQDAREAKRRRAREERVAEARPAWTLPGDDPEQRETMARLMEQVERLPSEEREVVVARIWSDLSFEDIGSLTGTSSSTAHRRYVAALRRLHQALDRNQEALPRHRHPHRYSHE